MAWIALAVPALAHWPTADEVLAEVRAAGPAVVTAAERDAATGRVLIVRVGAGWAALPSERRRTLAEAWRTDWREAVPGGRVGVVDDATGRPVVNYDAQGAARLPPPTPP